jgi:prolyl oligopeptidase
MRPDALRLSCVDKRNATRSSAWKPESGSARTTSAANAIGARPLSMTGATTKAIAALLVLQACGGAPGAVVTRNSEAPTADAGVSAATALAASGAPVTELRPVTDTYHGVSVVDPYRWLEVDAEPEVKAWSAAQNAYSRSVLERLPALPAIRARVAAAFKAEFPSFRQVASAGGLWFVTIHTPPRQQPFLGVMPAGAEPSALRVLLDPNQLDASSHTTIDFFVPAPDGKRVAVSLSRNGTESGDVTVIDVATGQVLPDRVPRVNGGTAGGDLAWVADGSGFFYTRYPWPGERPAQDQAFYQQVYFHALGSEPQSDRYELGKDLPRIAEIRLELDASSGRLLASVQKGDGGEFAHFLRERSGSWRQLSDFPDGIVQVSFAPRERLLAVSRRAAPRGKLLVSDARAPDLARARVLIPEAPESIVTRFWDGGSLAVTQRHIYLTYQNGGPSFVRAFDARGKPVAWRDPLQVASVSNLARDGASAVLFRSQSFVDAPAWYRFDETLGRLTKTPLAEQVAVDMSGHEVVRELATSKDGTRVPFSVVRPAGAKGAGPSACIVTGYGGYGLSQEPRYRLDNALWLEQGVIVVVANLRGGSEFGEDWHRQGSLERKQNVFDDFAAVLEELVVRGVTRPERTGIIGASNGGLLMGATLVQHPERLRAVVSLVGIYDSLREELLPNGEFNVTEFGTVRDPVQFAALYAYSPYHHVKQGAAYPATLLITGENDPRVGPMQTRKMAARLQAATGGSAPILFRSNTAAGHGKDMALDERIAEKADIYAFMFDRLGVRFEAARPAVAVGPTEAR